MNAATRQYWEGLGAKFVCIAPQSQLDSLRIAHADDGLIVVTDRDHDVKQWFGLHQVAVVILRPDRFVAAAGRMADIDELSMQFKLAISTKLYDRQ